MENIQFPLEFKFRIGTLANDFVATDASGRTQAYVRQKMFKFKEDIEIFNDTSRGKVNYRIKADRWLDFSAAYSFLDDQGVEFGKVARKGWRSLWKAHYDVIGENEQKMYTISEENPMAKVFDALLGEVPILSFFTGYLFNPAYIVKDLNERAVVRLKKQPSFFGRKFKITLIEENPWEPEVRVMLALMMMILLERRRG